ncbi:MAG: [FeFe] hydrogenase H-cluster maturation GTPase HydF [Candidatus Omnitrophota bacterium]
MKTTPKSLRLQIGLFGRTNVGKSSFLNLIAGQDVAITSAVPGTTTDVVEKVMELLPIGPVVFLDTAGIDDASELGSLRVQKSRKIFDRADVIVLIAESGVWGEFEDKIWDEAGKRMIPVIVVVNKADIMAPSPEFIEALRAKTDKFFLCSSVDRAHRDTYVFALKKNLIEVCPADFLNPPPLLKDLLPSCGLAVMIIPIDKEAPKGRLILPQAQAIRDALDGDAAALIVKEQEYKHILLNLKKPPDIVMCDSQVVEKMVADTPAGIKCTTFSILFARNKGDLTEMVRAVSAIGTLKPGDKILIAESCSHHAIEDDIGRVKIPLWLEKYLGFKVQIDVCSGRDYPENLRCYKLIVHCGGCMLTRREMLFRIHKAKAENVPVTNYGICIAFLQGVLERVLSPFPASLEVLRK